MNILERMRANEALLIFDEVSKLLRYEPETGKLYWLDNGYNYCSGEAGCFDNGYIKIRINGVNYRAHRIAYLLEMGNWPEDILDHHDQDGANNKWKNLRLANHSLNRANISIHSNNTSGIRGVRWREDQQRYISKIAVNGKHIHLGSFKDLEPAVRARLEGEKQYFGEFAHNSEGEAYLAALACLSM
jgi:HNH endonuclease